MEKAMKYCDLALIIGQNLVDEEQSRSYTAIAWSLDHLWNTLNA